MITPNDPGLRQKTLIIALLLCFAAIVLVSLGMRIANPSLSISSFGRANVPPPEAGMGPIGRLMNEAAQNPKDINVLLRVAEGLLANGQTGAASEFADRALALDEKDPKALHLVGVINHQQGRHAQAAEYLEKSAALADNPGTRYSLGVLYLHFLNDRAKGIANLKKALESKNLSPGLGQAIREELANAGGQGISRAWQR